PSVRGSPAAAGSGSGLLRGDEHAAATLRVLAAPRALLPVAQDLDARRVDAHAYHVLLARAGPLLAERHVVLGRADLVGVTFDQDVPIGVFLEPLDVVGEDLPRLLVERRRIELEEDRLAEVERIRGGRVLGYRFTGRVGGR